MECFFEEIARRDGGKLLALAVSCLVAGSRGLDVAINFDFFNCRKELEKFA